MEALANEVRVCWAPCDCAVPDERLLPILSAEERERHGRFRFERGRRSFLLAHALTRVVLAGCTGVAPGALEFEVNGYGKPALRNGPAFNLSHTCGMVAVAVTAGTDVGVDVEDTRRVGDWAGVSGKVFSAAELEALRQVDAARRQERFYEQWTLKEAYLKARGMGLSLPLDGFSVKVGEEIGIEFGEKIEDDPAAWQFALFPVGAFRVAAAARVMGGTRRAVRLLPGEACLAL